MSQVYDKQECEFTGTEYKKSLLKDYRDEIKQELGNNYTVEVYDANTHHLCKYCGDIAEGDYEDLLCNDCYELFGHALYSEL